MSDNVSLQIQLSPNSLNFFLECPHCFWLEKKKGIKRPQFYPYTLNTSIDSLLREEFDTFRAKGEAHPLLLENKIPAKLFSDQNLLNIWRDSSQGLRYFDSSLNAVLFGAPDDMLEFEEKKLAPLDYKSAAGSISGVYDRFQLQIDTYTFLLEKNGYKTIKKGYLAFYIVDKEKGFGDRLPFRKELHEIDTAPEEVYELFSDAVATLRRAVPPLHSQDCQYEKWLKGARNF